MIMVYFEESANKRDALHREQQLKNWKNRERIERLIKGL
jgi:predicted GIY-YIG superfamily endonuclease